MKNLKEVLEHEKNSHIIKNISELIQYPLQFISDCS